MVARHRAAPAPCPGQGGWAGRAAGGPAGELLGGERAGQGVTGAGAALSHLHPTAMSHLELL